MDKPEITLVHCSVCGQGRRVPWWTKANFVKATFFCWPCNQDRTFNMCEKTDGRSHEYKVYQEISDNQDKKNGISRKKNLQ